MRPGVRSVVMLVELLLLLLEVLRQTFCHRHRRGPRLERAGRYGPSTRLDEMLPAPTSRAAEPYTCARVWTPLLPVARW